MNKIDTAVSRFSGGFNCSQAILSAFAEDFRLDSGLSLKLATGFGGGMGGMGHTCGAVTGAFMVIGLKYGNVAPSDTELKNNTYRLVRGFTKQFEARHGSIRCKDLLHFDISSPAGYTAAKDQNLFSTICPIIVASAAEILEAILLSNPDSPK
jgi:C_GCAxxG_C_C family probable redox protein